MLKTRVLLAVALLPLIQAAVGCTSQTPADAPNEATSVHPSAAPGPAPAPSSAASSQASQAIPSGPDPQEAARTEARANFDRLVNELSEPDSEFFSDNFISNETSYLQAAESLPRLATPASAYIGVGPEQNFTYIAETRPKVAFIVDIRRQNMLLHLLYKAAFVEASSRADFLSLLLGRDHAAESDEKPSDSIDRVLELVSQSAPNKETFTRDHDRLMRRIDSFGVNLSSADRDHLRTVHQTFFDGQYDLRFSLKEKNGRNYPSLKELLVAKTPAGKQGGFLATDEAFRFVQTMEKEDRIIPLVGDFAGQKALPGLARFMKEQHLTTSVFYVSNVEQYLLDPKIFASWKANVNALPTDDASLFVRCYLDQGKKHPKEMKGHRTATVVQRIKDFETDFAAKSTSNLYDLSTAKVLD